MIEQGDKLALKEMMEQLGWSEGVIKPCVSGAARHTYRVNETNADSIEELIQPLLEKRNIYASAIPARDHENR